MSSFCTEFQIQGMTLRGDAAEGILSQSCEETSATFVIDEETVGTHSRDPQRLIQKWITIFCKR